MHLQAANGLVADESLQYECILEAIACRVFNNQWLCKDRIVVVISKENSEFKGGTRIKAEAGEGLKALLRLGLAMKAHGNDMMEYPCARCLVDLRVLIGQFLTLYL